MRLAGKGGRLQTGGRTAAEIGAWSADQLPDDSWRFTADITESDEWWRDFGPFTFIGHVGLRVVVWRDVDATIVGSPISMRAQGRPEWR